MDIEAAVSVKPVMNPYIRLRQEDQEDVNAAESAITAPTITAKPIIKQFTGRISLRRPLARRIVVQT
jgi:hypothetical protein